LPLLAKESIDLEGIDLDFARFSNYSLPNQALNDSDIELSLSAQRFGGRGNRL
jgi:ABC-type metal ion transport system substrate-binding protein